MWFAWPLGVANAAAFFGVLGYAADAVEASSAPLSRVFILVILVRRRCYCRIVT
jgi:hypothetical protein